MGWAIPLIAVLIAISAPQTAAQQPRFGEVAKQADAARASAQLYKAVSLYKEGVRLRPTWSDGWWSLGTLLYDQDRFAEGENAFRHLIPLVSRKGPAHAFLGLCLYETKDYDGALREFQSWSRDGFPGPANLKDVAIFHWALLLTHKNKFVESLYLLATEAGKQRDNPGLVEAMGLASLRIAKLPEDYPPEQRELVWLAGKAALYASLPAHDFDRADEYAARLLSHYREQPNVHYFVGTLRLFEHNDAAAESEFQAELRVSPEHGAAMMALASLYLEANRLVDALPLANKAVQLDPNDAESHHVLGRVLLTKGDLQAAVRELETAKRLAPDSPMVRSHLAMAYNRLGRTEDAKREAAIFLSLKSKEEAFAQPAGRALVPDRQPQ